jgi:hypothetical protein
MVSTEFGVLAAFGGVVLFAWAPLLGVERLRALFTWPTRWLGVNYLFVGASLIGVQCLSYLGIILLTAGTGSVTGGDAAAIIGRIIAANLVIPGVGAFAALHLLPNRGFWSPETGGLDGRLALGIGVIWYVIVTSVCFVLIGLVIMFANLPT